MLGLRLSFKTHSDMIIPSLNFTWSQSVNNFDAVFEPSPKYHCHFKMQQFTGDQKHFLLCTSNDCHWETV